MGFDWISTGDLVRSKQDSTLMLDVRGPFYGSGHFGGAPVCSNDSGLRPGVYSDDFHLRNFETIWRP